MDLIIVREQCAFMFYNLNLINIPIPKSVVCNCRERCNDASLFHQIPQNGLMEQCDLILFLICKI